MHNKSLNTVFLAGETEEDIVRVKDLEKFKIPSAPKSAFEMRAYLNTLVTGVSQLEKTERDVLAKWVIHALEGGHGADFQRSLADSQGLVRLDRHIAGILGNANRYPKDDDIGREIAEYVEDCINKGKGPRGRVMLNIIASEFITDNARGLTLISRALLNCKLASFSKSDINRWITAVNTIIGSIKVKDLPDDNTLFEWCFDNLRKCPKIKAEVEKVRKAAEGSHRRSWKYLFTKLKEKIREEKQNENQDSLIGGFDKLAKLTPADPKAKPKASALSAKAKEKAEKDKATPKSKAEKAKADKAKADKAAKEEAKKASALAAKAKAKAKAKTSPKKGDGQPPPQVRVKEGATRPTKADGSPLRLRDMTPAQKKLITQ